MTSDPSRADQVEFARRIALNLLEARSRSEHELRAKLASRQVPEDIADELIARFREVGLVDDTAFAQALTQTRVQVDRRGRSRIRAELRAKGVDDEVAVQALDQVTGEDELAAALAFAERRARSLSSQEPQVARRRLFQALARRGFSGGVCAQTVDQVMGHADERAEPSESGPTNRLGFKPTVHDITESWYR